MKYSDLYLLPILPLVSDYFMSRIYTYIFLLLAVIAMTCCIYRDIRLERQHPGDLRNRVVGARLQKDGISPYFYGWDSTQSFRYYDPSAYDFMAASNITASPFFHQLLYPIANIPQRSFSKIWLLIQYLSWASMLGIAISLVSPRRQRLLIAAAAILFLFTRFWTDTVFQGQNYFVMGWFCFVFIALLYRSIGQWSVLTAGVVGAALVLQRPTMIFFLLPFLFLWKEWPLKSRLLGMTGALLVVMLALGSAQSRYYWQQYRLAVSEHIKLHQQLQPDPGHKAHFYRHRIYEGWDLNQANKAARSYRYKGSGESSNVFVWYKLLVDQRMPVAWMIAGNILVITILLWYYYRRVVLPHGFSVVQAGLLGICLYMISDYFSPIHRFAYNGMPWLAALLMMGWYSRLSYTVYGLLLTALLLLSVPFRIIPMQHSIGEYLLLLGTLIVVTKKHTKTFA